MTQAESMSTMSKEMQDCVAACMECHSVCEETMSSVMRMGGQAQMRVMGALMDCADITRVCADMMMRRSPLHAEMCALCAKACEMCAEACMSMPDDPQLMRCAEACRRCVQTCRAMSGMAM